MEIQTQTTIHLGITGTFLQHNQFFKSAGEASKRFIIDGRKIVVEYKKAASYAHQHFAQNLCAQQGQLLQGLIGITGWLYPGAVVRHYAFKKQTQFEEIPARAFALLFAPVACQYFILRSRIEPQQAQYVLVIPEVTDLELYAQHCWGLKDLGYKNFHASSLGDAGLRFLTYEKTIAKHTRVKRCQVISFGKAAWSKQQKTRTQITVVEANQKVSSNYKFVCDRFPENRIFKYEDKYFVIPSLACEIVADNLLRNLPWWADFSKKINNSELFNSLIQNTQSFSNYTVEELIYKHTLYSFYHVFLPPKRAILVKNSMKAEYGGNIHSRTGIMASAIALAMILPVLFSVFRRRFTKIRGSILASTSPNAWRTGLSNSYYEIAE